MRPRAVGQACLAALVVCLVLRPLGERLVLGLCTRHPASLLARWTQSSKLRCGAHNVTDALRALTVRTCQALNRANVTYWLDQGTLLGVVRDGDLLPWDHDCEISFHLRDRPLVQHALGNTLQLSHTHRHVSVTMDLVRYKTVRGKPTTLRVDLSYRDPTLLLTRVEEWWRERYAHNLAELGLTQSLGSYWTTSKLHHATPLGVCSIPSRPVAWLKTTYGADVMERQNPCVPV